MFCTNCGKQIQEGAKFCSECGSSVDENSVKRNGGGRGIFSDAVAAFKEGARETSEASEEEPLRPFTQSKIYHAWVICLFLVGLLAAVVGVIALIFAIFDGKIWFSFISLVIAGSGIRMATEAYGALRGKLRG